jgi:hypothetical protein
LEVNESVMFDVFKNGSDRVNRRLVILECLVGSLLLVIMGVQGLMPSQDWIPPIVVKVASFCLAITGLVLKGVELFFNKTAALYQSTQPAPNPHEPKQEPKP